MSKIRQIVALLVGSVCVHVVVSCASSAIHSSSGQDAGVGVNDGSSDGASFLDALGEVITAVDGISTSDANADPATSGTRLHAVYEVTTSDDGATNKAFVAWHDSTLNVDCTFQTYSDGSSRCVPTTDVATSVGFFADAGCTLPLTFSTTCSTAEYVEQTTASSGCPATYGYKLWHAKAVTGPTMYYVQSGTTCSSDGAWPYSATPGYTTFVATAVVAPSELQSGTVTRLVE